MLLNTKIVVFCLALIGFLLLSGLSTFRTLMGLTTMSQANDILLWAVITMAVVYIIVDLLDVLWHKKSKYN